MTTGLRRDQMRGFELRAGEVTDAKIESDFARGITAREILTTSSSAFTDLDTVTDFNLDNVPVVSGHTYEFHLHTMVEIGGGAVSKWHLTLNVNGSVVDRFDQIDHLVTTNRDYMVDASCHWVAPSTQATDDFAVGVDEVGATTATLTLAASGTVRRTFTMTDLGVL